MRAALEVDLHHLVEIGVMVCCAIAITFVHARRRLPAASGATADVAGGRWRLRTSDGGAANSLAREPQRKRFFRANGTIAQ